MRRADRLPLPAARGGAAGSTAEEVAAVLRVCHEEGVPVVPRGSGTSLAGGALPTADSVILGVARMNA
jgi:glycolate oxidase